MLASIVSRGSKNSDRPSSTRSVVIGNSAVPIFLGSGRKISCACFSSTASSATATIRRIMKVAAMPAAYRRSLAIWASEHRPAAHPRITDPKTQQALFKAVLCDIRMAVGHKASQQVEAAESGACEKHPHRVEPCDKHIRRSSHHRAARDNKPHNDRNEPETDDLLP